MINVNKHIFRVLYAAAVVFSAAVAASCAKEKPQVETGDPYAFSFEVSASDGVVGFSGLRTSPVFDIIITGGEDVDYSLSFSVDGVKNAEGIRNVWLNTKKSIPFELTEASAAIGEHVIEGTVGRSDGNGSTKSFEVKYRMNCEQVTDITSLELKSVIYGDGTFETEMEEGVIRVPAADSGLAIIKVYPEDASLAKISSDNILKLYTDKAVVKKGEVQMPYRTLKPGTGKIYADWGGGVYEKAVRSIQFPTVGLNLDIVKTGPELNLMIRLSDYTNVSKVDIHGLVDYSTWSELSTNVSVANDGQWHKVASLAKLASSGVGIFRLALRIDGAFVRIDSATENAGIKVNWTLMGDLDGLWADNPDTFYFNEFATVTE